MRTNRARFILAAVVAEMLGRAVAPGATAVTDFEGANALTGWAFSNGPEFPGARGSLGLATGADNQWAELKYDFTPTGADPFDPHYVSATGPLPADANANSVSLRLAARGATPRVRLVDATGQTFQYDVRGFMPLEVPSNEQLHRVTVPFSAFGSFWGGGGDGVFHPPARRIAILAEATGRRDTGWLRFDDLALDTLPATPVVSMAETVPLLRWPGSGTLAERAGICINFYDDDRALDAIAAAGFTWIRRDLTWKTVESRAGVHDFSRYQGLVDRARSRGLRALAILCYTNALYTDGTSPPVTPAARTAYANYAAAAARNFAGTATAFEVWNEPDLPKYWGATPNPTDYGDLLGAAVTAMKAAVPATEITTGGLTSAAIDERLYIETAITRAGRSDLSALGMHLYLSGEPEERWRDMVELQALTRSYFPQGDLWCTEWGFSSTKLDPTGNGHAETGRHLQAVYTVRMLLTGWWADLPLLAVYNYRDDGTDAADFHQNFGLLTADYTEKPVIRAVRILGRMAAGRRLVGLASIPSAPTGMHFARLEGERDAVWVIWMQQATPEARVLLPERTGRVWDVYGRPMNPQRDASGEWLTLRPADGPVYLEIPATP